MPGRSAGVPLLLLFLAIGAPVHAQTPSGEISGTVVDSSGLPVPGVTVTLTNQATNVVRVVQTNEVGLYVIAAIPPGTYDLKAELTGFRTVDRTGIVVQVGSANRLAFTMDVGNLSETLEVVAHSPLIQTENAAISTVIENRAIVELPLNGRNYLQLASLIPGATTNGPSSSQGKQRMGGQRNSFALNVAGQRVHFNHYSLDGVENTDLNFNSYMLLPSVDALEEFNVVSGIFDAEYGRAIAQVNVSTKSGSNKVRGTAFEFLRNSRLD
ncbi:MAG: TonB-dependent receptor, partial [Acidobacteria bacterium]